MNVLEALIRKSLVLNLYQINMFRLITFLLFVVALCTGFNPVIEGGSDADIADYPYMVSIFYKGIIHLCGGSIISSEWVLTDAWCLRYPVNVTSVAVRSGSALLDNGTLHDAVQWIHHPQNNVYQKEYDFALVQVDPPFEFGENVAAVSLPAQDELTPDGAVGFIAGWGVTNETYESSITEHLQAAQISVLGEVACSELLGAEFQDSKLCVQDPNGVVAQCTLDEGGPLVIDGTAFGVILFPGLCANPNTTQVYARIASVRDWIDSTIAA